MAIQAQFPSLGAQDWVDSACGGGINHFYFNVQQQQLQQQQQQQLQQQQQQQQQQCYIVPQLQLLQQQQQQQQRVQNPCVFNNVNPVSSNLTNSKKRDFTSMVFPDFDQKQRREIDEYIRLQNERLRLMLQEQRKQQFALMLKNVESKVVPMLRQKDEEIAQLGKRKLELEDFLRKLEMENQAWQRIAQENEAMIMSLNSTIEQLREKASCCFNSGAEDAESCCDVNIGEEAAAAAAGAGGAEEAEQRNRGLVDIDNIKGEEEEGDRARKMMLMTMMMGCKVCNSRNSCILFLPCRHLCSCKACEEFLDSCPVCQTPKKASIEALMA